MEPFGGHSRIRRAFRDLALALVLCAGLAGRADEGFYRFLWGGQETVKEPAQKALIIHHAGREVLILQLKSDSAPERAGWLIPVPAASEVETTSMEPLYEASRLAQQPLYPNQFTVIPKEMEPHESTIRIKEVRINRLTTTKHHDLAVFSDAEVLRQWITTNHFDFSSDQATLDAYARRGWRFVGVSADFSGMSEPGQTNLPPRIELAPLRLGFDSPKPILPVAFESNRRAPSDVACLVLTSEAVLSKPILSKTVAARTTEYEQWQADAPVRRKQREDSERQRAIFGAVSQMKGRDPEIKAIPDERLRAAGESWHSQFEFSLPWDVFRSEKSLLKCMAVKTEQLPECRKATAALAERNQWFLTWHTFAAAETPAEPLEFIPAIPGLTELLQFSETALDAADSLAPLEPKDVPALLAAAHSANPDTRLAAAQVLAKCKDAPPVEFWLELLQDPDDKVRDTALGSLREHWTPALLDKLFVYLRDPKLCKDVGWFLGKPSYQQTLATKKDELLELTKNADVSVQSAAWRLLLLNRQFELSRETLLGLLKSTNFSIINAAMPRLQKGGLSSEDASVLVRSPAPLARMVSIGILSKNADPRAIELGIHLLRDGQEMIRIRAWQMLRQVTGQNMPYDQPEKWEAWWAAKTTKKKRRSRRQSVVLCFSRGRVASQHRSPNRRLRRDRA